jgi:hypothetical protein
MSEINFNPYTANVLDYVGRPLLKNATGETVWIQQSMRGEFMIYVNGKLAEDGLSNIAASSVLNRIGCRLA